jgi:hypothetical protein
MWTWGIDYKGQPLIDAWWTPGWTAQNADIASVPVPPNSFAPPGFPSNLTYVTVVGSYFDTIADPMSGYLTFWPSSALTFNQSGAITYMPQRYSGVNHSPIGINQMGSEKIYLWYGQLSVSLLATDNANMTPASFTYHVKENFKGGNQYDITVPSADSSSAVSIFNLIIPGSVRPVEEDFRFGQSQDDDTIFIAVTSSQYLAVDITAIAAGVGFNPTAFPVSFAFMTGASQPGNSDWVPGGWANTTSEPPFVATVLIGPNGHALSQGRYKVWTKIDATPQVPVTPAGFVEIY